MYILFQLKALSIISQNIILSSTLYSETKNLITIKYHIV